MILAYTKTGQAAVLDPAAPTAPTAPPLPRRLCCSLQLKEGMKAAVQGVPPAAQRLNVYYLN